MYYHDSNRIHGGNQRGLLLGFGRELDGFQGERMKTTLGTDGKNGAGTLRRPCVLNRTLPGVSVGSCDVFHTSLDVATNLLHLFP